MERQYTALERKWLSCRVCGWCEISLLAKGCGSIMGDGCDMVAKRTAALATYKPRPRP